MQIIWIHILKYAQIAYFYNALATKKEIFQNVTDKDRKSSSQISSTWNLTNIYRLTVALLV